jgi:murein L,D-transpeptidase YcbB/YkuD
MSTSTHSSLPSFSGWVRMCALAVVAIIALGAADRGWIERRVAGRPLQGFESTRAQLDLAGYLSELSGAPFGIADTRQGLVDQVRTFYERRGWEPVWIADGQPRTDALPLLHFLGEIEGEGLVQADFQLAPLVAALSAAGRGSVDARPARPEEIEVGLTWAALLAVAQMRHGRTTPQDLPGRWEMQRVPVDLAAVLEEGLRSADLTGYLRSLGPTHPQFAALLDAYRRARSELATETQAERRAPIEERLQQLRLNLDRWRWVPDDFGSRAVVVNIPGFTLDVEERGRVTMSMRTVVGEVESPTPVFAGRIRSLVLNPYWNVPPNILAREVLPALQADASYLANHDMEVVRAAGADSPAVAASELWAPTAGGEVRVRQRPGPRNPLGKVKFMFPNEHDVYLHDTTAPALFARPARARSHGCVRLERPLELAELLLDDDPRWRAGALDAAIASGEERHIPLRESVPVFLVYMTAAAQPDGDVAFYDDVYGLDRAHQAAWRQ